MIYYCSKCKLSVIIIEDKKIKVCKCKAPIIAEMVATVYSSSKLN